MAGKSNVSERLVNGIIKENPTFVLMLGMCPTLAVTTSAMNGLGMGLTTAVVLALSNMIISLMRNIIPNKVRIPAFIVIIASFVTVVQLLLQAYLPDLNGDGVCPALLNAYGGYCMNKNSKEKEAAWEFLKFMGCDEGAVLECERTMAPATYLKMAEPTYDLPENGIQNLKTINTLMQNEPMQARGVKDPDVSDKMYEVLTKLAYDQMTPEEAASEVDKVINAS